MILIVHCWILFPNNICRTFASYSDFHLLYPSHGRSAMPLTGLFLSVRIQHKCIFSLLDLPFPSNLKRNPFTLYNSTLLTFFITLTKIILLICLLKFLFYTLSHPLLKIQEVPSRFSLFLTEKSKCVQISLPWHFRQSLSHMITDFYHLF